MLEESLAPVFRVGNVADAVAWYQRLGFQLHFEHSAGPGFSRTQAVVGRGALHLVLSDCEEDGRPEGLVILRVADDVESIASEFNVAVQNWVIGKQVELRDPDGNRIRIVAPKLPPSWKGPADAPR